MPDTVHGTLFINLAEIRKTRMSVEEVLDAELADFRRSMLREIYLELWKPKPKRDNPSPARYCVTMDKLTSSPEAAYLTSPNIVYPQSERGAEGEVQTEAAEVSGRADIEGRYGVDADDLVVQRELHFYVPAAPAIPTLGSKTATTVTLNWTAVAKATGYNVYKAGVLVADVGNLLTKQVTGLTTATAYSFTVKAYNAVGLSAASPALAVTTS